MTTDPEILQMLNDVARVLHDHIGQGKALGMIEVGETVDHSERTVDNYSKGKTTGSMDLEAIAKFAKAYRDRFPGMTDPLIGAICRMFNGEFVRKAGTEAFDDANGNGKPDCGDVGIHSGKAIEAIAENIGETAPAVTAEEVSQRLTRLDKATRHAQAARRILGRMHARANR